MSCLLAMMRLTELTTFIAHAPTSDTAGVFFSASMAPPPPLPSSTQPHANPEEEAGFGWADPSAGLVPRLGCLTREGPLGYKAQGALPPRQGREKRGGRLSNWGPAETSTGRQRWKTGGLAR